MPYVPAELSAQAPAGSGGTAPPTGYYEGTMTYDEGGPGSNAWTTRHLVAFQGISPSVLLNWPYNDEGEPNPKALKEGEKGGDAAIDKKLVNQAKYVAGVVRSAGLTQEEMDENGYDHSNLDNVTVYFQFHNGDDFDPPQKYGDITQFITAEVFDEMVAAGRTPKIPHKGYAGNAAAATTQGPPARTQGGPPARPAAGQAARAATATQETQAAQPAQAAAPARGAAPPPVSRRPAPPTGRGVTK